MENEIINRLLKQIANLEKRVELYYQILLEKINLLSTQASTINSTNQSNNPTE